VLLTELSVLDNSVNQLAPFDVLYNNIGNFFFKNDIKNFWNIWMVEKFSFFKAILESELLLIIESG